MGQQSDYRPTRATSAAFTLLALLLALVPSAQAAPPAHQRQPALDIPNLNHACGVAVDNQGDVYASSAGESKIKIFDSSHTEIGSIEDAHEPCGLAVDSHGDLFVSRKATGTVVRYVPGAFPFAGAPSYGPAEAIDSSGEAAGIGIDNSIRVTNSSEPIGGDDSLYVAKGDHIDAYSNESQRVQISATAGTFKLSFEGQETAPLPYNASHAEMRTALEALSTIGAGNVSVTTANFQETDHLVVFTHKLGLANQPQIGIDTSGLTGSVFREETNGGLLASTIGQGTLTNATGVAAFSYKLAGSEVEHYVFAADKATNRVEAFSGKSLAGLKARAPIEGPKAGEDFGFGASGAYLAVDPGNGNAEGRKCAAVEEQACTAGHLLVYDDAHEALDEFDASGRFLDQAKDAAFADAEPTAMAIERSGGAGDGTIYVSAGAGAGAKLLAFEPLQAPSREQLEPLSHKALAGAQGAAVDSFGDLYVAVGSIIHVYGSDGKEIAVGPAGKGIPTAEPSKEIAVDSTGKVYVLFSGADLGDPAEYKVGYYTPGAYPPTNGTLYSGPTIVADGNSFNPPSSTVSQIAIDPANDRLFVGANGPIIELGSAAEGSPLLNPCFACALFLGSLDGIGVYGVNGDVYVSQNNQPIFVIDSSGTEVLHRISGAGSPAGSLPANPAIAVDQSNGHVLAFEGELGHGIEEYDASGGFVAAFGKFTKLAHPAQIAIDNSGGANDGDAYLAYDNTGAGSFDATAFGRLEYPEVAIVEEFALTVSKSGSGEGTVTSSPAGIECGEDCSEIYEAGAEVTLTASPAEGSTFGGWSGSGCSGTGTCEVTMDEAKSVTAEFSEEAPPGQTLTVHVHGEGEVSDGLGLECTEAGEGTAACDAEYPEGTELTLTASAGAGYQFAGWSEDCVGTGACAVTMDAPKSVTATFEEEASEPGIPLTVAIEGTGSGTVASDTGLISCQPFCEDEYEEGAEVTLTASPASGSLFMAWKHCDSGRVNGRQCTVTMSEAKEVSAVFATAHGLSVTKAPGSGPGKVQSYGGLTCLYACTETSSLIREGTSIVVKETPAKHFHFTGWSGDCAGTGACELTMGEDHEVLADFEEDQKFALTLSKTGGGQGLVKTKPAGIVCGFTCTDASASFYEGEVVTVSWKLNKGTTSLQWTSGAGACTGKFESLEGTCAVTMDAAKGLVASFE